MLNLLQQQSNVAILMTACINPNGMEQTTLQDPKIRKAQYLEAIDYYLNETKYDIVFCENTGKDIYDEIRSPEKHIRLEYLTFCGNDYDKRKGKSYGEAVIIQYAIHNSKKLQNCEYIIKITGRVKILNLNSLAVKLSKRRPFGQMVALEFSNKDWAKSVCFFSPKEWLLMTVRKYGVLLSDTGCNFEKMISDSISETKGMKICQFHPIIDGICAWSNTPYKNYNMSQRKLNHFDALSQIYKSRGSRLKYAFNKMRWLYHVIKRKMYVLIESACI